MTKSLHGPREKPRGIAPLARQAMLVLAAVALASCSDTTAPPAAKSAPDQISALLVARPYTQVRSGFYTSCAVISDGGAACWGYLAAPAPALTGVTRISPSNGGACAITSGSVSCFGPTTNAASPTLTDAVDVTVAYEHACALRSNGQLACWGNNRYGQYPAPELLSDVVEISAGGYATCARHSDNSITCIGTLYGQALVPASLAASQISTGVFNVCATTTSARAVCWGNKASINAVPPDLENVAQVSTGLLFACARLTSGTVRCWGDTPNAATAVPSGLVATQISSGFYHTCALRGTGALVCWGSNEFRQSSPPPLQTQRVLPTATFGFPGSVLAGSAITLSLTDARVTGGPADLTFTYAFDCGDGSGFGVASENNTATCPTTGGGTRAVQGKVIDPANDFTSYTGTVEISQAAQAIIFTSTPPNPAVVGSTYAPTATGGASGNPVNFSSLTPTTCSATNGTVSFVAGGECTIAANQAGNAAYLAAPEVTQGTTATRLSQVITITSVIPPSVQAGSQLSLSATGGASGLPVIFASQTLGTCTVSGSSLTLTDAGTCTFVATQAGNAAYDPATPVERSTIVTLTAFEQLRRSVASATISATLRSSLLDKLDAAAAAMDANNRKVACRYLSQFANQVRTQSGRGIPIELADSWLALVGQVARQTGC